MLFRTAKEIGDYGERCAVHYLRRRGYTVNVGKIGDGEIGFVAVRQNEKIYVQVTQLIGSEDTEGACPGGAVKLREAVLAHNDVVFFGTG